jgi:iron complex outermembrane receptor protein
LGLLLALTAGAAERPAETNSPRLADLSLEQLLNEPVTSVSKKETKLGASAAAISVITAEDIRRSGATSIPEALRLVPGLNVARINANEWAISARGFNAQYGNKLLVLVDGRSVYTPAFSGVFWSMQDLMLKDLDRIEVIRGPGSTLWGANAVNGVINIMTKSAKDTQGFLGNVTYGTDLQPLTSLRYGGQLGTNLHYRVYGQFLSHDNARRSDGSEAQDQWDSARTGVRLDWQPTEQNHFTLQGDYNRQRVEQTFNTPQLTPPVGLFTQTGQNHNYSGNVLGRWTHTFESGASSSLQAYYDTSENVTAGIVGQRDAFDVDWQHHLPVGSRNEFVWGLGYRYLPDDISDSVAATWTPNRRHNQLFSAFLQDEIKLMPDRLTLTLGSKFEHNDYTGMEIQPSGRLLWTPSARQTVWGAVSRAVRTPNRVESDARFGFGAFQPPVGPPVLVALLPTADLKSEELIAYELGYRVEPAKHLAFDLTGFYNTYQNLHVTTAGAARLEATPAPLHVLSPLEGSYNGSGVTYGVELQAQWRVTDSWRLTAGYTWLHMRLAANNAAERASPAHQFNLRSYVDLTKDLELNSVVYYVNQTTQAPFGGPVTTPAYVRLDLGVTWRPTKQLELSVWGQNLLDDRHAEFTSLQTSFVTEIPRSVFGKITWRF